MTYVVGIRRFGVAAIITDSFLSKEGTAARDWAAIKSGILFEGCIFGICGAWERAWAFINVARTTCVQETLGERLRSLGELMLRYNFIAGEHNAFEILLSVRIGKEPRFLVLRSATELIHATNEDLVTLGSGSHQLDEMLRAFSETAGSRESLEHGFEQVKGFGLQIDEAEFAFHYAFALFQRTGGGDSAVALAQAGVGGFVHFITQNVHSEQRQDPSLYVLTEFNERREFVAWMCLRISFDYDDELGDVLVFCDAGSGSEDGGPGKHIRWGVLIQNSGSSTKTFNNIQPKIDSIIDKHKSLPLYRIMLAGGIDWERRGEGYNVAVNVWDGKPAISLDGEMQMWLYEFLQQHT